LSKLEKIKNNLESGYTGQLCMINFVDGVSCKVIDGTLAKDFINTWANAASSLPTLDEVLGSLRPTKESHPKYQSNSGIPIRPSTNSLFTVMDYKYIRGHLSNHTLAGELALAEDIYTDYLSSSPADWSDLETELKDLGSFNVTFAVGKGLKRSFKNIVWVSRARPGEPLSEAICFSSSGDSDADTARENLGLVHISRKPDKPPPILVALEIDKSDIPSPPGLWRPTQIDAEAHTRFRGAYGDLQKNATGWGRAIHLHKLSDRNGELGAPEAVTLNFRPERARLWYLGYPRLCVDDGSVKDEEFVRNVAHGRLSGSTGTGSPSTISRRFLALCS
jgi:hypothetical protein